MFIFAETVFLVVVIMLYAAVLIAAYALSTFFSLTKSAQNRQVMRITLLIVVGFLVVLGVVMSPLIYKATPGSVMERVAPVILFDTAIAFLITVILSVVMRSRRQSGQLFTTKNITRMAIFTALSVVLYHFVKFPLPILFPSFLDIQFSEMPALLAGLMIAPEAGVIVVIIKILIKLPSTSTGGVGELADLVLGLVYVLTTSYFYRLWRTKKGALLSLIIGSVACVVTALLLNRFVLIPFYTTYMLPWPALLRMVSGLYPGVTRETFYAKYLWAGVLPFNVLRCGVVVAITFFMYKPTKRAFGFVEGRVSHRVR